MVTVTAVGNLGRDPELKDVGDSKVCSFSIAANRKAKGEEHTDWYNVDAWGKLGELCAEYLSKGRTVVVSGDLAQRSYEAGDGGERTSLDIRANAVHFMPGKSEGAADEATPDNGSDDDDIPF